MSIEYGDEEQLGHFTTWRVQALGYIFGYGQSGQTLVGPHELGAQTITPPGYMVREPEDSLESYTTDGWRHNVWQARSRDILLGGVAVGLVWISGDERPVSSNKLSLTEVVAFSAIEVPDAIEFIKDAVEQQARHKNARIRPFKGRVLRTAGVELEELEALRTEARGLFGKEWVKEQLTFL